MTLPYPVTLLLFPGAALLDIAGPLQAFKAANDAVGQPYYALSSVSRDGGPVETDTGARLMADAAFDAVPDRGDLLVPGGPGVDPASADSGLIARIQQSYPRHGRLVGVCSGALLLAEAGLLDGRAATSHWSRERQLRTTYPQVHWQLDDIFVASGDIHTSAGVTAGIDLSLALIEADLGPQTALAVARELVVYLRRSGGQSQYSRPLQAQTKASPRLASLCSAIAEHPERDWRVTDMSEAAGMTERSLHRHFVRAFGASPARFVESIRLAAACGALQQNRAPLGRVAETAGFRDVQSLRRAFVKQFGVTPTAYHRRFATSASPGPG